MNTLDELTFDRLKKIVNSNPYFEAHPMQLQSVKDYRAIVSDGLYYIVLDCERVEDTKKCYDIINSINDKELQDYVIDVLGI